MDKKEIKIYTKCITDFCQKNSAKYDMELFNLLLDKIEELINEFENEKITVQKLVNEIIKIFKENIKKIFKFNDSFYKCIFQKCNKEFNDVFSILKKNIDEYFGFLVLFILNFFQNKYEKYDPIPKIKEIINIIKSTNNFNIKDIKKIEKIIYELLLKFFKVNHKYIIVKITENKSKFLIDSKRSISELRYKIKNPNKII